MFIMPNVQAMSTDQIKISVGTSFWNWKWKRVGTENTFRGNIKSGIFPLPKRIFSFAENRNWFLEA